MTYIPNTYATAVIALLLFVTLLKFVYVIYRLSNNFKEHLGEEEIRRQEAQREKEDERKRRQEAFERSKVERNAGYKKQQNAYILSSRRISRFAKDIEFYENCRDPYAIIGCTFNASLAQMKKNYRALVKKWHPDIIIAMNVTKEEMHEANRIMQIINMAYDEVIRQKAA